MASVVEPGATLGSYRIERLLGRGGMGAVFLAYDTRLHRQAALKLLGQPDDPASGARLLREARTAAGLNHPHICTIYEVGETDGTTFIAMERVEGRTLRERIDEGPLSPSNAVRFVRQAADALAFAHDHGVVHRDLKAANVIVSEDGRLKVVDFGLARRDDPLMAEATTMATLAPAGTLVGTPYAMSPEQVRGEATDPRTDIWALGVLLHESLSGAKPFAGRTGPELLASILTASPAPLPASIPAELRDIVERCLQKDPARRYQRAADVRDALDAMAADRAFPGIAWRPSTRRRLAGATAVALLAFGGLAVGMNMGGVRDRLRGTVSAPPIKLAVLPIKNLSGDPGQEYFSDGLTDEVITQLSRLHPEGLKVIARSTAMQYKEHPTPIDAVAGELGVDYVLEGSARREGNRVRITATLIQVRDRTQRWAESFDRDLAGILTLQSDVARGVAGALALTLLPAEQARLAAARPVHPEAYQAYLLGQSRARRLTRPDLDRALEYYETAVKLDPNFALAHFGISGVWAGRVQVGLVTAAEGGERADAALMKALSLDSSLPEGHMALANRATWEQWDWTAAEASYRRALDLNPNLAEAHSFYAHYLFIIGRREEGASEMQRALELDPLNDLIQQFYGMTLQFARRFEEGIAHAQNVLKTNPNSPSAWNALTANYHHLERFEESLSAQRSAFGAREDPVLLPALAQGYQEGGYRGAMLRVAEVRSSRRQDWVAAQSYLRAGEVDRAIDALERAYDVRSSNLPYISVLPVFDVLRSEPRFQALLKRMNLPQ
jgi:serine/threonine-protein kinase